MGVDGIDKADIFDEYFDDEYFDDEKPKYIIKNCPGNYGLYKEMCGFVKEPEDINKECADCTDCAMKRIVELAKGYKEELIDRKTKKVVATRYFKLTKEILELLDIQEVE